MEQAMKVKLIFHGVLKKYNHGLPEREEDFPDGATVGDAVARARVPAEEIAFAAVNDSKAPASQKLKEGDRVKLFQLVGGG